MITRKNGYISLVVPVLNEEQNISSFYLEAGAVLGDEFEIVFVDDGSSDKTPTILDNLRREDSRIKVLTFVRHYGKEAALMAGLRASTGDAVIPIDVDQQDPLSTISALCEKWQCGHDVVLAKRRNREGDNWFKKTSADIYHSVMGHLCGDVFSYGDVGDFRLLDRSVVDKIITINEKSLYMKGIMSLYGENVAVVEYDRVGRSGGESKFTFKTLANLGMDGLLGFSPSILRAWAKLGFTAIGISCLFGFAAIFHLVPVRSVIETSALILLLFFSGCIMVGLGVVGEYLSRILTEAKGRPSYILTVESEKRLNAEREATAKKEAEWLSRSLGMVKKKPISPEESTDLCG